MQKEPEPLRRVLLHTLKVRRRRQLVRILTPKVNLPYLEAMNPMLKEKKMRLVVLRPMLKVNTVLLVAWHHTPKVIIP